MQLTISDDITSLTIQLNELRSEFDKSIRNGGNFAQVRVLHFQIKEMECYLKALDWNPATHVNHH